MFEIPCKLKSKTSLAYSNLNYSQFHNNNSFSVRRGFINSHFIKFLVEKNCILKLYILLVFNNFNEVIFKPRKFVVNFSKF